MKRLIFEGHSDDTFGEYGVTHDDYDNCASGNPIIWEVRGDGTGLLVHGQYGCGKWPQRVPGCWVIGVQPFEDNWCGWPMRFELADNGYSPRLIIDAPDDVTIDCLNRKPST